MGELIDLRQHLRWRRFTPAELWFIVRFGHMMEIGITRRAQHEAAIRLHYRDPQRKIPDPYPDPVSEPPPSAS